MVRKWIQVVLACLALLLPPGGGGTNSSRSAIPLRTTHVPILMYHYVSANPQWPLDPVRTHLSVTPKAFATQLSYLRLAGYTSITLDDLARALHGEAGLPAKPIILTFDDGYQDFYDNAFPLLKKYRDLATIYIITGKVGHPGYMTWAELRELAASPLITIGAHTRTHPDLRSLTAKQSWGELAGSKVDLEVQLGIPVQHLAYPSGEYNASVLAQVRQLGFATAVTTHEGFSERTDQLLALERVRVNGYTALADLIAGLQGQRGAKLKPLKHATAPHACLAPVARELGDCPAHPVVPSRNRPRAT